MTKRVRNHGIKPLVDELVANRGCPVPWSEISTTTTGKWRMCCYANEFPDMDVGKIGPIQVAYSERMNKIRAAMLNGDRHIYEPWCERCIVMERQGQKSRREKRLDAMTKETVSAIDATNEDGSPKFMDFEHFDIKFAGNKCNLRCYMCHPYYSSGVALDWKKMGWWNGPRHINPLGTMTEDEAAMWWQGFDDALPIIKVLNFTGGEPFLMDDYWLIMDFVVNTGHASGIELHLSSNLTELEHKGRRAQDYFEKFKRVHLQVSVDAFGPQYNWIRYPGSYSVVMDNIERVRNWPRVDVQVSAVMSALSIFSLPALLEDMDKRGLPFRFDNVLTEPKYMRVASLPMWAKHKLRHVLTDERTFGMLPLLDEPEVPEHWEQLVNHCDRLDKVHRLDRVQQQWRWLFPLLGEGE